MSGTDDILKVSANAVDALKAQPALLFLIMLNVIVFASSYFALEHAEERKAQLFTTILERCTFNYADPQGRYQAPPRLDDSK